MVRQLGRAFIVIASLNSAAMAGGPPPGQEQAAETRDDKPIIPRARDTSQLHRKIVSLKQKLVSSGAGKGAWQSQAQKAFSSLLSAAVLPDSSASVSRLTCYGVGCCATISSNDESASARIQRKFVENIKKVWDGPVVVTGVDALSDGSFTSLVVLAHP